MGYKLRTMMMFLKIINGFRIKGKKGSPILEEILLIGIAILIFAIIFGLIFNLIDWTTTSFGDFFS
ncbi:MAG: hypothetical protein ACXAAM_00185 [Candidatus Heimdallarchaeaceae archaeon]